MTISACSSCEAAQPARYPPSQRGTQRAQVREPGTAPHGTVSQGRRAYGQRAQRGEGARPTQSAQAVEFQRSTSRSAEITVTTAEGDKVTLSLAAQTQQTQSAYRARGKDESGQPQNIRGGSSTSQSSTSVNVGIEGDLNEKELADIKKLIEAFGQLTQGDSSGIAKFGQYDSLASAKFSYQSTEQSGYGAVKLYA